MGNHLNKEKPSKGKEQDESKEEERRYVIPIPDETGKPCIYVDAKLSESDLKDFFKKLKSEADLMRGVVLGLFLGILGNLFVAHYYSAYSSYILTVADESTLFVADIVMAIVFLAIFLIVGWVTYVIIKGQEKISESLEAFVRGKRWRKAKKDLGRKHF